MNAICSSTPPVHSPWITFSNTFYEIILICNILIWLLNLFRKVCNLREVALRVTMLHTSALQSSGVISVCKLRHSMLRYHLCPSLPIISNSSVGCPARYHTAELLASILGKWSLCCLQRWSCKSCALQWPGFSWLLPSMLTSLVLKRVWQWRDYFMDSTGILFTSSVYYGDNSLRMSHSWSSHFSVKLSREKDLLRSSNDV